MIAKFASVTATVSALTLLALTVLLGAQGFAQGTPAAQSPATTPPATAPAAQQPAAQQPDTSQEPADIDSISRRKAKPRDYKNWTFNVGAGANLDSGATKTFVRGGGGVGTVGVARNANKYLGLRADFIFTNLPLRDSTLELAQATSATSYALDFTLDPIINIPVTKLYSGYVLFGPGFYRRAGSLNGDTALPGSGCNAFWTWWGACANSNVFIPLSGSFVNSSQNQFGYNIGAGVARKMPSGVEVYLEYRLTHGSSNGATTDTRPITIGVRW
jgi:opacity protein-like surface antigen